MARTESKTFTVCPNEEHEAITTMQTFGWNLLNIQEIRTEDTRIEERSAGMFTDAKDLYSVTTTTNYLRVSFSRDLDEPNLQKLRELEGRFMSMGYPVKPFTFSTLVWIVGGVASICLVGIPTLLMAILHFAVFVPKVNVWKQACSIVESKRDAIVAEARQY